MKKIILVILILFLIIIFLFSKSNIYHKYIKNNNDYKLESRVPKLNDFINKKSIHKEVSSILYKYPSLKKHIKATGIKIPNEYGFIPQGMEKINEYTFITGYFENGNNSICYIIDDKGEIVNEVDLNTTSHVGSISYDKINNLIFIPGLSDSVLVYNYIDFFTKDKIDYKYKIEDLANEFTYYKDKNELHIAFLKVYNNYLYIGSFNTNKPCLIKKFKINRLNNNLSFKYINSFTVNEKVQGIDFINKDDKKYMLLSSSFGRIFSSNLYVYLYEDGKSTYENYLKKYTLPPMLEQISCYGNSLYLLFESNAYKYSNALDKINYIIEMNIDKIIEE